MSDPQTLSELVPLLRGWKDLRKLAKDADVSEVETLLDKAGAGDSSDLEDLFEQIKADNSEVVHTIEGAAPDDDVFDIEVCKLGPLFFIRANEFDDIGYFASEQDAVEHAEMEFEGFISELAERREQEEEE